MLRQFTDHPASVGESYAEHRRAAFGYGWRLFKASICCTLHGLFPWLHTHTGSHTVRDLYAELSARQQRAQYAQSEAVKARLPHGCPDRSDKAEAA